MKVAGFTFVKNAVKFGYPVIESIRSVLPVVDEMVICLGDSDDDTEELIKKKLGSDKVTIIHSVWDNSLKEGGRVLAVETDKAMDGTPADADWLFYIQADEVVHEKYHSVIREAMVTYKDDRNVEGLLFHYHHFYGSFKYIGDGRAWYSKEIRVIRNDKRIRSYRDAQGFRWNDNRKLRVKLIDAYIYHYGWVRNPLIMYRKQQNFGKLYGESNTDEKQDIVFDYSKVDTVTLFTGTHPEVMKERTEAEDWHFERDIRKKNFKNIKHKVLYFLWQRFGWRPFEYSNYKKI